MSNLVKNIPQDFTVKYKPSTYTFIEKILNQENRDIPMLLFMLSLLGFSEKKKIPLNTESKGEEPREISIRTLYMRNESDFDAYIGLIAILDNMHLSADQVINSIAFERTSINGAKFYQMQNVKTFFEYMLGGIDVFIDNFFIYNKNTVNIVDAIHEYLISEYDKLDDLLINMLLEEDFEYE